jgi:hypothetical protein
MFNLCNNDLKKHLLTLAYILLTVLLTAQTVSGKKDIAVFRLSHSGYVPSEIVDRIDQRIIGVITSFKRFNVIGMEYRMSSNNITSFIDHIKSTKEHQSEISETVLSGEEAFTRADWERLTSAFLIFAPRITDYDEKLMFEEAEVDGKKVIRTYWEVEIAGAVSIIDVSGSTGERVIPLSVRKIAKQRSDAVADAITSLTSSIYSAIKFEPEFALTSGILEVDRENNTVTIELGKDIGVHPGDEYILQKNISIGGKQSSKETGLIIISEVYDTFSIAKVIYADQPVVEGDAVKERVNSDIMLQGYAGITVPITGVKATGSKDYLRFQPTFGIRATYKANFHLSISLGYEYAIQQPLGGSAALSEKPMRLTPFGMGYVGIGMYNFYTSRFKITPELQVCFSGTSVATQTTASKRISTVVTAIQFGGRALISADYFISRKWTIGGSAGVGYMHSLLSPSKAAEKLKGESIFPTPELDTVNNYAWDVLSSHLHFYAFIGITGRF